MTIVLYPRASVNALTRNKERFENKVKMTITNFSKREGMIQSNDTTKIDLDPDVCNLKLIYFIK